LRSSAATWQISGGSPQEMVTVQATVVSVNGQFFYVARLPFETRIVGTTNFGATTNVLGLRQVAPAAYRRRREHPHTEFPRRLALGRRHHPASIAANKIALLRLECFGTADTDVLARYLVES
jgi:hypothetical protein